MIPYIVQRIYFAYAPLKFTHSHDISEGVDEVMVKSLVELGKPPYVCHLRQPPDNPSFQPLPIALSIIIRSILWMSATSKS